MHSNQVLYVSKQQRIIFHHVHIVHIRGGRAESHFPQSRARRFEVQRPDGESRRAVAVLVHSFVIGDLRQGSVVFVVGVILVEGVRRALGHEYL